MQELQELLEFILHKITKNPEEVEVQGTTTEDNEVNFTIHVDPEDMGIVIGKGGKTVKSIRNILNIIAVPQGIRVSLDIEEKGAEETFLETPAPTDEEDFTEPAEDVSQQEDELETETLAETEEPEDTDEDNEEINGIGISGELEIEV